MNTRQAIQPSTTPAVLSLSFSSSRKRFIAGFTEGLRVFRTDNCLTTCQSSVTEDGGLGIAAALDDRYIAFVGGGRFPASSPNVVIFWDCLLNAEVNRFDCYEPVLGVHLSSRYMVVILQERAVVFEYRELEPQQQATPPPDVEESTDTLTGEQEAWKGPNVIKACHATSSNPYALACLRGDTLVLPAQATGQVQLVPLQGGSKRVMRVHNSAIRSIALSPDGTLLATASETGTLIRVFDTQTQDQLAEFRRGVEHAIVYSLAVSDTNRWLACTSDKGTMHIFDLNPTTMAEPTPGTRPAPQQHRKSFSQSHQSSSHQPSSRQHRLSSAGAYDGSRATRPESTLSSRQSTPTSTPHAYQGSIQEYYGLRPPPLSSSPHATASGTAFAAALKSSPFAPRIVRDVRSVASTPFHTGNEGSHWQGGKPSTWVMAPDGTLKRVRNPIPALAGEPSGRPRKGIVAFAPVASGEREDEGCKIYVVGGGSDARWEVFDLVRMQGGGWTLVKGGFRRYLTRQFVE